ncbi:hypothetical protein [Deinococcus xianganensis]|uniref:Uncharacterized protein n=1 Tax=Deinococcus xianganensis TaxID=1507289 RepID=A0A6I4YNU4_9DEIO|nr:hypothetical protein [Deinococcus xianganensis]MXV21504.1 hypothetical protein [Deinococcus xianganensis]
MDETTSPLIRFADLLEAVRRFDDEGRLPRANYDVTAVKLGERIGGTYQSLRIGDALCRILGQELPDMGQTYPAIEQQRAYLTMTELAERAFHFVYMCSGERSRTVNLATVNAAKVYADTYNAQSPLLAFQGQSLPEHVLQHLHALAENLSLRNTERLVSPHDQEALLEAIADLLTLLQGMSLPPALHQRMFQLLEELQAVVRRLHIVNPDELVRRVDEFMGLTVKAMAVTQDSEGSEAAQTMFEKTIGLMGQVAQVVEHVQVVAPALMAVFKKIPGLPWSE